MLFEKCWPCPFHSGLTDNVLTYRSHDSLCMLEFVYDVATFHSLNKYISEKYNSIILHFLTNTHIHSDFLKTTYTCTNLPETTPLLSEESFAIFCIGNGIFLLHLSDSFTEMFGLQGTRFSCNFFGIQGWRKIRLYWFTKAYVKGIIISIPHSTNSPIPLTHCLWEI